MRIQPSRTGGWVAGALLITGAGIGSAQIDPERRSLLEIGYDQPLVGEGPQAAYVYYYYNNPAFFNTNTVLRLAAAPVYLDGELGFKGLLAPYTDFGIGFYGGAFGDNYYDVQQGDYRKGESFNGSGGGLALGLYQLLNPGMLIPLHVVIRGGARYTVFSDTDNTEKGFTLPENRTTAFIRAGLRFGGKEPVLYPDLGLEVSAWYERQWRFGTEPYGFGNTLQVSPMVDLCWLYAGLSYAWTNTGHKFTFATTAGTAPEADRFSAWRLGGVLPLVAEFPLVLPGYFYEEITAQKFLHLYGSYQIPLDHARRWQFRAEAASALIEYLPGYAQPGNWQSGIGCAIGYISRRRHLTVMARVGYGFNALRDGHLGGYSAGVLLQYDFRAGKKETSLQRPD